MINERKKNFKNIGTIYTIIKYYFLEKNIM